MAQRNALDPTTSEALKQQDQELRQWWRAYGPPVEVHFRSAGLTRQVAHQLGAPPDGYIIVRTTGALYAVTPERWTEDLALLKAPDVNTRAILIFYTLREEAIVV